MILDIWKFAQTKHQENKIRAKVIVTVEKRRVAMCKILVLFIITKKRL
jgi:hypothetical protein